MAFIFADLIVLPIIAIYRKYYGTSFTVRIVALMFVTMVIAALVIDGVFSGVGLIPGGTRPSRGDVFGTIAIDYKLALNVVASAAFAVLFWLTARRGATDPVCGMKVDRAGPSRRRSAAGRCTSARPGAGMLSPATRRRRARTRCRLPAIPSPDPC